VFEKLLVANRGEIAVRIIRAAKELGLRTVAVYSDADKDSLAVRMADEAIRIGPPPAAKSYLSIEAIIDAARRSAAQAIHPGYGFLSENAHFAEAVETAGLVFVGPRAETIRLMGDKVAARAAAAAAGVPVVPGSEAGIGDVGEAIAVARRIGFPVMLKASAGGGGRGIRVVPDETAFAHQFHTAQAEAQAAFGNGALYLERFLRHARHLEVQVLGDGERVVHCFERECSLQRRRQKIWEEAPAPAIDDETRQALCDSAVRLAERSGYRGAGTLEYLYDQESGEFFFIEMNTRIQVEHPVTELVTGIDLVREMIRIARGERLRLSQADIRPVGAAIEVRLNAEDPDRNFHPAPGRVTAVTWPGGPGVRVDSMLYPGYVVPPYYDSLLAKIIVHAETRNLALSRLRRALDELEITGIATTAALHKRLVGLNEVQTASFDTGFLEQLVTAQAQIGQRA
jgi:acetyl-CoA carboxylase, biotin carboxylase subunit